jgi:chemotaxis protein MotB
MGRGGESSALDNDLKHVVTRVTDEGLVIELFDLDGLPLFGADGAPTETLKRLSRLLAQVGTLLDNQVAIAGHVASVPVVLARSPVWDTSVQRADAMRQLTEANGLKTRRFDRITGHADRDLAVRDPMAPRNNRIEFVFLRSDQ